MNREYHKWYSPRLHRDMELLVFGHGGARVIVFPTRAGRFFDYENFGIIEGVRQKIDQGWVQLFCVDSIDAESFYCRAAPPAHRIRRHVDYDAYLLYEVIPFTHSMNRNSCLIVHGCSMGAFHAVNFAFRHPDIVTKVLACSGRYDLTAPIGDFCDLLDGYYDDLVYFNTPLHFVPSIRDEALLHALRRIEIHLAVGYQDPFHVSNVAFSERLHRLSIMHQLHVWHGRAHKPDAWCHRVDLYL
ncbi:MAG: esterase family protein [Anaerolineales bacterium]|nr:esterase family protein [Anaerolineales bacterium]